MENNFYNDHFEQFLKETVDDFRMYPSKRVWSSIYNNLHPGRKWPSLATSLLIIVTITLFGVANKTEVKDAPVTNNISQVNKNNSPSTQQNKPMLAALDVNNKPQQSNNNIAQATVPVISTDVTDANNSQSTYLSKPKRTRLVNQPVSRININDNVAEPFEETAENNDISFSSITEGSLDAQINSLSLIGNEINKPSATIRKPLVKKRTVTSFTDKEWIEDFAFHNKPVNKWRGRLSYQLYATPSIGYRSLVKNNDQEISRAFPTGPSNSATTENYALQHSPSWNLEAGGTFLLSVSKALRLKAGMQLNYTRYQIGAQEMDHPVYTTLLLNNPNELVSRSSSISNIPVGAEATNLNSSTYQISMPLGADFKIAGNNNFKWFAGATIQPSYVFAGNPYLISSDMKNYIYDMSMMRRFNLNTSFETFISITMKNGAVLNAGPQLRYQLLSTYDKRYSYDEKLYNLGIKLGITRNF